MGGRYRICKERQMPLARDCGGMLNTLIVFLSMSLVTGTAFADEPLSIIDTVQQIEVATSAPFLDQEPVCCLIVKSA